MKIFLTLTWWKTFFVHCTQHDGINDYRNDLSENVFACMELSGQSYTDIMKMPVKRLQDYLKWKSQLEEEKQKRIKEENN